MVLVLTLLEKVKLVLKIRLVGLMLDNLVLRDLLLKQESKSEVKQKKRRKRLENLGKGKEQVYWVVAVKVLTP